MAGNGKSRLAEQRLLRPGQLIVFVLRLDGSRPIICQRRKFSLRAVVRISTSHQTLHCRVRLSNLRAAEIKRGITT